MRCAFLYMDSLHKSTEVLTAAHISVIVNWLEYIGIGRNQKPLRLLTGAIQIEIELMSSKNTGNSVNSDKRYLRRQPPWRSMYTQFSVAAHFSL